MFIHINLFCPLSFGHQLIYPEPQGRGYQDLLPLTVAIAFASSSSLARTIDARSDSGHVRLVFWASARASRGKWRRLLRVS